MGGRTAGVGCWHWLWHAAMLHLSAWSYVDLRERGHRSKINRRSLGVRYSRPIPEGQLCARATSAPCNSTGTRRRRTADHPRRSRPPSCADDPAVLHAAVRRPVSAPAATMQPGTAATRHSGCSDRFTSYALTGDQLYPPTALAAAYRSPQRIYGAAAQPVYEQDSRRPSLWSARQSPAPPQGTGLRRVAAGHTDMSRSEPFRAMVRSRSVIMWCGRVRGAAAPARRRRSCRSARGIG